MDRKYLPPVFAPGELKARSKTRRIVIHCLDTPKGWKGGMPEIDRWHREERGWKGIGYHYVIFQDGTVVTGRPLDSIGAHCVGWNSDSVAIALAGGEGAKEYDSIEDNYSAIQEDNLYYLIEALQHLWPGIPVVGHTDHPKCDKVCPGFNVRAWAKDKHLYVG